MTLGGYVVVRNGDSLDYSWREAVASLIPVCEEVVIADSDSTDGTKEAIELWMERESKIRYANFPWKNEKGVSHRGFVEWLNFAREQLSTDMQITLDADEVLSDSPECHAAVREAASKGECRFFHRLNFWRDPRSIIPDGHCCARRVARMGPANYVMCSDEPHHPGEVPLLDEGTYDDRLKIFHLGFLRKTDAFYRKANVVLHWWFGRGDPRLSAGEETGKKLHETECEFTHLLEPYYGYMPDSVQRWLSARGHATPSYIARLLTAPDPVIEIEPW